MTNYVCMYVVRQDTDTSVLWYKAGMNTYPTWAFDALLDVTTAALKAMVTVMIISGLSDLLNRMSDFIFPFSRPLNRSIPLMTLVNALRNKLSSDVNGDNKPLKKTIMIIIGLSDLFNRMTNNFILLSSCPLNRTITLMTLVNPLRNETKY